MDSSPLRRSRPPNRLGPSAPQFTDPIAPQVPFTRPSCIPLHRARPIPPPPKSALKVPPTRVRQSLPVAPPTQTIVKPYETASQTLKKVRRQASAQDLIANAKKTPKSSSIARPVSDAFPDAHIGKMVKARASLPNIKARKEKPPPMRPVPSSQLQPASPPPRAALPSTVAVAKVGKSGSFGDKSTFTTTRIDAEMTFVNQTLEKIDQRIAQIYDLKEYLRRAERLGWNATLMSRASTGKDDPFL